MRPWRPLLNDYLEGNQHANRSRKTTNHGPACHTSNSKRLEQKNLTLDPWLTKIKDSGHWQIPWRNYVKETHRHRWQPGPVCILYHLFTEIICKESTLLPDYGLSFCRRKVLSCFSLVDIDLDYISTNRKVFNQSGCWTSGHCLSSSTTLPFPLTWS